jgi:small subunit ribosomal protein S12
MIKTLILYKNFNQLAKIHYRKKKIHKTRTRALIGKPQIRGTCLRVVTRTPRKPNSA